MSARIRVSVCREGWYYLFVVIFIIGGAVLREVNLLVALAGLMIGPPLLNWRMAVAAVNRLSVARRKPGRGFAGQPVQIELTVQNHRWRLASWMVRVSDQVQRLGSGRDGRTRVEMLLPVVAAGESAAVSYRLLLHDRGRYRLGPVTLGARYPLGLIRARRTIRQSQVLIMWPQLGRLTAEWARIAQGQQEGPQPTHAPRRADGEFYALRPWLPGDSRRQVHWRTTARVGAPVVKQHEPPARPEFSLVLDLWTDATATPAQLERVEQAVRLAATIVSDLCRKGGSLLTVILPGAPPRVFRSAAGGRFAEQLLDELATVAGGPGDWRDARRMAFERAPTARPLVISTRQRPASDPARDSSRPRGAASLLWISIDDELARAIYQR